MRQWRAFIVDSRPTVIVRELQFAADPVELRNRQYSLDERRNCVNTCFGVRKADTAPDAKVRGFCMSVSGQHTIPLKDELKK